MTQTITLDLPEHTVQRAHETAVRTGRSFEIVLAEWVERGLAQDDLTIGLLNAPHHLYSPLGGEATAQALETFLKAQERSLEI